MTVLFVKPIHHYNSYTDYWRLVKLANYGIVSPSDIDHDSQEYVYIHTWFTVNKLDFSKYRARHIAWINEWVTDAGEDMPTGIEMWSADKWMADSINAKYVPLGSNPQLALYGGPLHNNVPKVYDVVLNAYRDPPRRASLIGYLTDNGVTIAPDKWGVERHTALTQSRLMIHIHQHENTPTVSPLRWALAAAYQLPLISENVTDAGIFGSTDNLHYPYENLASEIIHWRNQSDDLQRYANNLYTRLCVDYPFKMTIERAL